MPIWATLPAWGLLLVVATAVGWGLGWPMMKIAMHDWPPLFARGCAGLAAALGLAIIAVVRGQNLLPSRSLAPRLALGAATNVFAPMGLTALALLWLTVAQAALLTFSMPIWATLLAWPILGERPRLRSVIALCLGVAGLVLLMGANLGDGIETFPGVALALAAAILFALGAVTSRAPIPLPPMVSTAWQIGQRFGGNDRRWLDPQRVGNQAAELRWSRRARLHGRVSHGSLLSLVVRCP